MKAAMLTRHIPVPRPSGSLRLCDSASCRIVGCIEGKKVKTPDSRIYDAVQSRHPSLSTTGILRLSERCLSEASLANAQNTEERKAPRNARRGIGGPFFWFVFFGQAKKMNTQPSARSWKNQQSDQLRNLHQSWTKEDPRSTQSNLQK
jgi:hypothetical protein